MKVAVVSRVLPPSTGGQAVLLYRLLKNVDPTQYCFISTLPPAPPGQEMSGKLDAKYFTIGTEGEMRRGYRFGLQIVREAYNVTLGARSRAKQIAEIVRAENCDAILSCSSGVDLLDVPAGFYASQMANVAFYSYMFDTYSHMWINPQTRFLGRFLEPYILKRAAGTIVTNESVQDLLEQRYGIESYVIHNPCDLTQYEFELPAGSKDDEFRIVYTGAIYEAHYDAIRNLLAAITSLGRPEVKLHLYTSFATETLTANGIRGPVVFHAHEPAEKIAAIQKRADILFLPLAFHSPYPELIKVSSPSKVGEFLMSGTPVLVHAPRGSFLSKYFREHDCGVVVDQDDPKVLARELSRLMTDDGLRRRVASNAVPRAEMDFGSHSAELKLADILKLTLQDSRQ